MLKVILAALLAVTAKELPIQAPELNVAQAEVQEPVAVTEMPKEPAVEAVEMITESELEEFYPEPQEEMPTPADEFEYREWQLLGTYHITHYSAEECGNCIGAAEVDGGMVEGLSCAMPEHWMLGHTVLIENYGFFRVDDISPDGVADIFHYDAASAVGEDWQNVYLVD